VHFLLACPGYAHERWSLVRKAKKLGKPFNIATILGNPDMSISLAEYIENMQRFTNKKS